MKVAFVLNSPSLYGANRSLLSFADYLIAHDIKCYVILGEHGEVEEELQIKGIPYKMIPIRPCVWYPGYIGAPFLVNLLHLGEIKRTLRDWGVDIVHTNNSNYDIGMIAARQLGIKHVWHIREIMETAFKTRNIFPRMYKRLRMQSDAVICVSQFIKNYNMQRYPNKNMVAMYDSFDVNYYTIERDSFCPGETYRLINAGVFTEQKRTLDSIMAVHELVQRGVTNVHLSIIGDGEGYAQKMRDYIAEQHLESYVEILEFASDLRDLRYHADAAVCCSYNEALSRVLVESMLSELLLIVSQSGGNAELAGEHNERGYTYELGDVKALADQIQYSMEHKAESRQKILAGKEFAIENFEWERNSRKVVQLYDNLLSQQ